MVVKTHPLGQEVKGETAAQEHRAEDPELPNT